MASCFFRKGFHMTCADAVIGNVIADAGNVGPSVTNQKFRKLHKNYSKYF